jgi:hypothetical protein
MTLNRRVWTAFVFLALAVNAYAFQAKPSTGQIESYFDVLAKTDFGNIYADDGAGDGSATQCGDVIESGPMVKPKQPVKTIVDLGAGAIPILIDHLDDARATSIVFAGRPVRLGHLALDILTHIIVNTDSIFISDCVDDGLGACILSEYYFRPDAPLQRILAVKAHWQAALKRGMLRFEYPNWWAK